MGETDDENASSVQWGKLGSEFRRMKSWPCKGMVKTVRKRKCHREKKIIPMGRALEAKKAQEVLGMEGSVQLELSVCRLQNEAETGNQGPR